MAETTNQNNLSKHKKPVKETLYFTAADYYNGLISGIQSAKDEIILETFIYADDKIGRKVAHPLMEAAKKGITVKILVDGAGCRHWKKKFMQHLEKAGVETKIYHPFPWRFWQWSRSTLRHPLLLRIILFFLKINTRNHRKTCIIDNEKVIVGSLNIADRHFQQWRDTAILIENIDTKDLRIAFDLAWNGMNVEKKLEKFDNKSTHSFIRLNYTQPQRHSLYHQLLKRFSTAELRIWITNGYFLPNNKLLNHLIDAAKRGVDVRLLIPGQSDVRVFPLISSIFYPRLLKAGVRIFEYRTGMLHAKTLIIDDWHIVGSSNLNYRSLLHDLEVDMVVQTDSAKEVLVAQFRKDLNDSTEILLENWPWRPRLQRLIGRLVGYIRYIF